MPRTIPVDLLAHLQGEVVTLAVLVKLTRSDGTILGFTSSTEDITYLSQLYKASDGLSTSAMKSGVKGVDNFDADGVLSDSR
ncbi:MAG: DUF2163 domain-containing protein, partial [Fimbriimonadaceae bacterium]